MSPTRSLPPAPAAEFPPTGDATPLETHWTRCLYSDGFHSDARPAERTLTPMRGGSVLPDRRPAPSPRAIATVLAAFVAMYIAAGALVQVLALVEETAAALFADLGIVDPGRAPAARGGDAAPLPSASVGNERPGGSPARQGDVAAVSD